MALPYDVFMFVKMNHTLNPEEVLWTYFDPPHVSLSKEYIAAQNRLNSIVSGLQAQNATGDNDTIVNALRFLQTAINVERSKEKNFINYMHQKHPSMKIDESLLYDPKYLQITFNKLMGTYKGLQEEANRLNPEKGNSTNQMAEDFVGKVLSKYSDRQQLLSRLFHLLDKTSLGKRLAAMFELSENNKPKFNSADQAAILITVAQLLIDDIVNSFGSETPHFSQMLDKAQEREKELQETCSRIEKMLDEIDSGSPVINNLRKNLRLDKTRFIRPTSSNWQEWLGQLTLSPATLKVIEDPKASAELATAARQIIQGAFYGAQTGSTNAKPDAVIAFLSVSADETSAQIQKKQQKISNELNNFLFGPNGLKHTNDIAYYNQRIQEITNGINKITGMLGDDEMFLIEDSTKYYETIGNQYQNPESAFHGGSLGKNLIDQLSKICSIANEIGAAPDFSNLLWATVQSSPGHIGQNGPKTILENYFSIFATIFLFDDQGLIVRDALNNMLPTLQAQTSVQRLHIFSLNDGYYPLSFVLELCYNRLSEVYSNLKNQFISTGFGASSGATTHIEYKGKVIPTTVAQGITQTVIKINFLNNFTSLLTELLTALNPNQ